MSGNPYETLAERLKVDCGIKLVALDFDLTLISVHTGGTWMFTAPPLASKVRPGFTEFLVQALKKDLCVAVVTFSPQVELVKEILRLILPATEAEKICIRGSTSDWKPSPSTRKEGKLSHIESAAKYFSKTNKMKIKLTEVLLLDDDDYNIRVARENSVRTLKIKDNNSLQVLIEKTNIDEIILRK